jgi:hypothetical protein
MQNNSTSEVFQSLDRVQPYSKENSEKNLITEYWKQIWSKRQWSNNIQK